MFLLFLSACSPAPQTNKPNTAVFIPVIVDEALSWHAPAYSPSIAGMRLLRDGPRTSSPALAITRAILRTNPRLSPVDALRLAAVTVTSAQRNALPPEFLAATVLQESAYDPRAISFAGAVGIAQFMPDTAAGVGVDPFDPYDAIAGAAALLGSYARLYATYPNPLVAALAAYNAGPGAVDAYHGVPPYAETRDYVNDIMDRWAKIAGYEAPIRSK